MLSRRIRANWLINFFFISRQLKLRPAVYPAAGGAKFLRSVSYLPTHSENRAYIRVANKLRFSKFRKMYFHIFSSWELAFLDLLQ